MPTIGYEPEYVTHWLLTLLGLPLIGLAVAHAIVSHAKATKVLGIIVSLVRTIVHCMHVNVVYIHSDSGAGTIAIVLLVHPLYNAMYRLI